LTSAPWRPAAAQPAHADILAAGVHDDRPRRIGDQLPEAFERAGVRSERVDQIKPLGRCDLNQTEVRMIRVLADKLGVEAERRTGRDVIAARGQLVGV